MTIDISRLSNDQKIQILGHIVVGLVALIGLVGVIFTVMAGNRRAKADAKINLELTKKNNEVINRVEINVNSRLTQFIEVIRKYENALGVKEGILQQKAKENVVEIKQTPEIKP
jgi:sensor domain CHASE-containing protein